MLYKETWNLDSIFEGGSDSPQLENKITEIENRIDLFGSSVTKWEPETDKPAFSELALIFEGAEGIENALSETMTFATAHHSADVNDTKASSKLNHLVTLSSHYDNHYTILQKKLESIAIKDWEFLITQEPFNHIAFRLNEIRKKAGRLLSTEEETVVNTLSNDGFNGWENMYESLVSSIEVPIEEDGKVNYYSAGQAENKMNNFEDPKKRQEVLDTWEQTWKEKASLFANTLNHLAGFRLSNYQLHGEDDYLKEPLQYNRMKKETLDTMWHTINKNKSKIVDYLNRKAKLLGVEKLGWTDVTASLSVGDFEAKKYTYNEAADFILENFSKFSPKMKNLAQRAFENQWIEAEDRSNKRPGGYCSDLPESGESRIFMTFSGSADNVSTLAHELGHAFHSHVMRDLPVFNQEYAMNVAETASTFAETIVSDATIKAADSKEETINLLDNKNSRAATMFMNIQARFIFEKNFHEERKNRIVSAERLSELMEEAQKEAYDHALSSYHPMFWASKLHFYNTEVPFYNFPYTFGYLFSLGIYARSLENGSDFEDYYIALLRDTASMTTEELAQKHLNVDLTQAHFWQSAIDLIHKDIDEFIELTDEYVK